jgi:hypothetical protein
VLFNFFFKTKYKRTRESERAKDWVRKGTKDGMKGKKLGERGLKRKYTDIK